MEKQLKVEALLEILGKKSPGKEGTFPRLGDLWLMRRASEGSRRVEGAWSGCGEC